MKKVRITQTKSGIGYPLREKMTLKSLGLRRMHQTVEHDANPQIMGMIAKVCHLVKFEEFEEN
ncbi:MAG: 50S ribosomal protein L30 [Bacteroidales bacterium]|nr:50S ribosomal protein L30 [Bacteroidales bacterium]